MISSKNGAAADQGSLIEKPALTSVLSVRKDLIFIFIFFLVILALYLSPLKQYRESILAFCEGINRYGALAPLIFILSVAVLVCIGMPRLLLCTLGGMLFGFYQGLLYSVTGTIIGSYIVFSVVRLIGRTFIVNRYPKLNNFTKLIERGGIPGVILARQIPIHGMVMNLILGLSTVKQSDFLIGSAIGFIPEAIPFTLIGTGVKQGSLAKSIAYIVTAVVILAALWLGLKIWTEKKR